MGMEIERKYLIKKICGKMPWEKQGIHSSLLQQGYLHNSENAVVRVRTADNRGFLTIKGKTENACRKEFEYEIPLAEAIEMLALCQGATINKRRYCVDYMGFIWEIDVFSGDNAGLVVAEIELKAPDQVFPEPPWLGKDVTHDPRYYNSNLVLRPFCRW